VEKAYRMKSFFQNIRRRVVVLALLVSFGFLLFFGYSLFFIQNNYTTSVSLMLLNNQSADNTVESQFQKNQTTREIVANAAILINSTDLIQLALDKESINRRATDFRDNIHVEQVQDSHILRITIQYSDPVALAAAANTYAEAACVQIQTIYQVPPITAEIIERSSTPSRLPNILRSIGSGLGGALIMLLLYVTVSVFLILTDKRVRSASQLSKLSGKKVLCSIPNVRGSIIRGSGTRTAAIRSGTGTKTSDAYRILRSAIKYSSQPYKTIAVVSPMPKDGRTSVTVGLATAIADSSDSKILIIEADIRRPHIKTLLQLNASQGLADVLVGKSSITSAITKTGKKNLFVLTSSSYQTANSINPSDVLDTENMGALLEALYDQFDYIIVDTPAVALVPDATCVSGHVDACLMVARYGHTNIDVFSSALGTLENIGANVIGLAVTAVPQRDMSPHLENYYAKTSAL